MTNTRPQFSFYVATFVTEKADLDYVCEQVPAHTLPKVAMEHYPSACVVMNMSGTLSIMDHAEMMKIIGSVNLVDNECFIAAVRGAF